MSRRHRLHLAGFLPYRLSVVTNVISSAIAASYAQRFALSIPEWRVLAVLGETADLSAAEVATRTAMDKVAVSRAVAALLAARRISRTITVGDRRRSALRLTTSGQQIYAQVVPIALEFERQLLQPLDATDRAALQRILAALLCRAEALKASKS